MARFGLQEVLSPTLGAPESLCLLVHEENELAGHVALDGRRLEGGGEIEDIERNLLGKSGPGVSFAFMTAEEQDAPLRTAEALKRTIPKLQEQGFIFPGWTQNIRKISIKKQ